MRLGASGATVALNYVSNGDAAKETQALITQAGGACALYQADIARPDQVGSMFAGIEAELGPVELLVTNAGIARSADGAGMTAETWRE
ncbi:MAG: SDR family oxidoreductase, partial [Geminicoccaceae bacterium]